MQLAESKDVFLNMRYHLPLLLPTEVFEGAHAQLLAKPELGGSQFERAPVQLEARGQGQRQTVIQVRLKSETDLFLAIAIKAMPTSEQGLKFMVAVGSDQPVSEPICQALRFMLENLCYGHHASVPRSQEVCHLAFELLHVRNPRIEIEPVTRDVDADHWEAFIRSLIPHHWTGVFDAPKSFVAPNGTRGLTLPVTLQDGKPSCILVQCSPGGSFLTYAAPTGYLIRKTDAVHRSGHVSELMALMANVA